jgi:phenylacetate-CoA ligase
VTVHENGALTQVKLEVEPTPQCASAPRLAEQVEQALHEALHFRAEVVTVASGTLPRFELKGRRFLRLKDTLH